VSKRIREWVHTLLTLTTLLFMVSGIGIVEQNLVSFMTLGLITKDLSYQLHSTLLYPFALLLFLHVYFKVVKQSPEKQDQK
jgi:hypothetical protein